MGKTCEVDVDDCAGSPCHHGSTCSDHVNGFSCSCLPGYTGSLCEVNYNECGSGPCRNGGICADGVNAYLCLCKSGFTGENCEVDFDDCNQAPCKNGGEKIAGFSSHLITIHWTKFRETFFVNMQVRKQYRQRNRNLYYNFRTLQAHYACYKKDERWVILGPVLYHWFQFCSPVDLS